MSSIKIVFMGTPDFAVPSLESINKNHNLTACFTQPSRPSGRGQKIIDSPVKKYCLENKIPVYTPENFKKKENIKLLENLNPDLLIVAAYGLILAKEILNLPKYGAINIHASLLPKWRGAAPIQRAILAGDKETGISIMKMNEKLDTGDVITQKIVVIKETDNAQTIHDQLSNVGANLIDEFITMLKNNKNIKGKPQKESEATYAKKITTDEGKIIWAQKGIQIINQIRAFNPFPGAWFSIKNERVKIYEAIISKSSQNNTIGKIIDNKLSISAGGGDVIHPKILQRSGKKPMIIDDFIRGFNFQIGSKLD